MFALRIFYFYLSIPSFFSLFFYTSSDQKF